MLDRVAYDKICQFHRDMPQKWNGRSNDYLLALVMEVAELVDSTSWKPWGAPKPVDTQNLKREIIDIIFFLVHIMRVHDIKYEDLAATFDSVIENNYKRYTERKPNLHIYGDQE